MTRHATGRGTLNEGFTRREFLHTVAGVAASTAIVGHDAFAYHRNAAATESSDDTSSAGDSALQSWIFPEPQEISGSGSDFILNDRVRILVPPDASEQDLP